MGGAMVEPLTSFPAWSIGEILRVHQPPLTDQVFIAKDLESPPTQLSYTHT